MFMALSGSFRHYIVKIYNKRCHFLAGVIFDTSFINTIPVRLENQVFFFFFIISKGPGQGQPKALSLWCLSAATVRKAWLPGESCTGSLASTSRLQHQIQTLSITLSTQPRKTSRSSLFLPILSKFLKIMNQGWDVAQLLRVLAHQATRPWALSSGTT